MFQLDVKKIKSIIERRLVLVDEMTRSVLPSILQKQPTHWIAFADKDIFFLIFLTEDELKRVSSFQEKKLDPFPGLFTLKQELPSAFAMSGSRFGAITGNTVKNSNSFYIGPDVSFFIVDHTQSVNTVEEGEVKFNIPLAYFISFGLDIAPDNIYQNLEELVVYSIKEWRKGRV